MILAMSTDIRVILVKLADRMHNMRTLGFQSPEKQRSISTETMDIYAPLAGRMGIQWIKSGLEDLCLYYLEPEIYENIQNNIAQKRGEREKFIREVKELLTEKLKEYNIEATVKGRHKHIFSIYKKMQGQDLTVNQVYDIIAFRVIVKGIKECYELLGHIHSMWKPVSGRFKDYISVPKANMYQSLHTTVIGPLGQMMELQIRTWDMDRVAEEGIAAHWKYKEGAVASKTDEKQFAWLRQLLEWQQNLKDPGEFLESVRMDLFPDEVYVFTPTGEVKAFPRGATPIDFAYSIHSEVGEKCMGAKVNGKMVPLKQQLKNGSIVEIITSPKQHPRKDWLDFVKTPKAKNKIRHWINSQEREESIIIGKNLLEKALEKDHLTLPNIMKNEQIAAIAKDLSFHSEEDLIVQIGLGNISPKQVTGRIKPMLGITKDKTTGIVGKMVGHIKRRKKDHGIMVEGMSDMLIRFANCCNPLPGERIIGFITRGHGITIHNQNCIHIDKADPERLVEVSWNPSKEDRFTADLKVTSIDKKGILAEITSVISHKDINIINASISTTLDNKAVDLFTIEVRDFKQLQDVMSAIKKLKGILTVERISTGGQV